MQPAIKKILHVQFIHATTGEVSTASCEVFDNEDVKSILRHIRVRSKIKQAWLVTRKDLSLSEGSD